MTCRSEAAFPDFPFGRHGGRGRLRLETHIFVNCDAEVTWLSQYRPHLRSLEALDRSRMVLASIIAKLGRVVGP
jgi:hypothetical protein